MSDQPIEPFYVTIPRLERETNRLRAELEAERALTGKLTTEIGKRDCEIAGLRLNLSEIVMCCDEGGTHGRIREIALDALGEEPK